MVQTPRFSLSAFGSRTGGSIADDNYKFTDQDRFTIDALLAAFETHNHNGQSGVARLADPVGGQSAAVVTSGGNIQGSQTLYYGVTFIDRFGLETAISPAVQVEMPTALTSPPAPDAQSMEGGGLLRPGQYRYALTYVTADGAETMLSPDALVTLVPGDGSVLLGLPELPAGASGIRVWRQPSDRFGYTKLGVVTDSTFTDDGMIADTVCAVDEENLPPAQNLTSGSNSVTVTLSAADAAKVTDPSTGIRAWRLYRSEQQGSWAEDCLVHEVVEAQSADDPQSPLRTEWTDVSQVLLDGAPPVLSRALTPAVPYTPAIGLYDGAPTGALATQGGALFVYDGAAWRQQASVYGATDTLPDPTAANGTTVIQAGELKVSDGTEWKTVTGGGGGGTSASWRRAFTKTFSPGLPLIQQQLMPLLRVFSDQDASDVVGGWTDDNTIGYSMSPGVYFVEVDLLVAPQAGVAEDDYLALWIGSVQTRVLLNAAHVGNVPNGLISLHLQTIVYVEPPTPNQPFVPPIKPMLDAYCAGVDYGKPIPMSLNRGSVKIAALTGDGPQFPMLSLSNVGFGVTSEGLHIDITWSALSTFPENYRFSFHRLWEEVPVAVVDAARNDQTLGWDAPAAGWYEVRVSDAGFESQYSRGQLIAIVQLTT